MVNTWYMMIYIYIYILVGGLEHGFYFSYIGNSMIPTDELIFFTGVGIPPTRYYHASSRIVFMDTIHIQGPDVTSINAGARFHTHSRALALS